MTAKLTSHLGNADSRLAELGISLPPAPTPFGSYVEAVQTGNLLFLSGMLPTVGHHAVSVGRVGKELDMEAGGKAARTAAINALAVAREHLGSLDRVTRVVRLSVYIATAEGYTEHPKVADAASQVFRDVFGAGKMPARIVLGIANLPLGVPVELELIFEVLADESE
jgi:enamine deaminase RidA (YjgF/YER057c/UK114 family)